MRWHKHIAYFKDLRQKHERWSMDCIHDLLFDNRPFRVLTVVDQWSRQIPLLEPALTFSVGNIATALAVRIKCHTGTISTTTVGDTPVMANVLKNGDGDPQYIRISRISAGTYIQPRWLAVAEIGYP